MIGPRRAGRWAPQDGRTLDIDFLKWRMWVAGRNTRPDVALSVSRPSARGFKDAFGVLQAAGNNAISRDHDDAGAALGLQLEPQSENRVLRSGDLANAAWGKGGATVVAGATAPDGVQAFGRITEGTAAGQHYVFQNIGTLVIGDVLTITAFVRATGIGPARHVFLTAHGEGSGVFNPATGAVVSSAGVTASVKPWGPGVYRVRATITKTNTTGNVYIGLWDPSGNNSYTGNGVSCADVWGVQVELRGTPTSYMPTGASTAVRYADGVLLPFEPWGSQSAGTIRAVYKIPALTAAGRDVFSISNAAGTAQLFLRATTGANNLAWILTSAGAEVGRIEAGVAVAGQREVIACSYGPAGLKISRNGGSPATNGTLTTPVASPATLYIGQQYFGLQLDGWLERLSYRPAQLADADLQAWVNAA